jgi:glycosyltransferase involved in cell wall biosynthesis
VAALRKRGHDVRVVTTRWDGLNVGQNNSHDGSIYYLPAYLLPRNKYILNLTIVPISLSITNMRRILEIVSEFKPDVIHQINHIFDTLFLSAYAARKTQTPLVGSISTPLQSNSFLTQTLMHIADLGIIYNFGVRHWQRIICSDSTQTRYTLDAYGDRVKDRVVTHIYVGVHERIKHGNQAEKALNPHIVMVGHVHEIRDPRNIIRAMPAILERFPDARLEIAGRVQFTKPIELVKQLGLESSVHFLGEVPAEQVSELVSKAHVFAVLHQCKYAGLSFTAIEAMQFETPVIINAPDDLYGPGGVKDGGNILLVDGDDVAEIASKIIRLLEDQELRRRIGRNGKEFVTSHLNWDVNAEKTEQLYRELIS